MILIRFLSRPPHPPPAGKLLFLRRAHPSSWHNHGAKLCTGYERSSKFSEQFSSESFITGAMSLSASQNLLRAAFGYNRGSSPHLIIWWIGLPEALLRRGEKRAPLLIMPPVQLQRQSTCGRNERQRNKWPTHGFQSWLSYSLAV